MNLFMVLIPFLLLTAVFARTTIIDLRLPQESMAESDKKEVTSDEVLTISVTDSGLYFSGLGKSTPPVKKKDNEYDFELLTKRLEKIKDEHPEKEEVILLFSPDAPYELIIRMMDATRETSIKDDLGQTRRRLFPAVSVGEYVEGQARAKGGS